MTEIQNSKLDLEEGKTKSVLGHWILKFEIYLEFGAWDLGFINSIFRVHSFQA